MAHPHICGRDEMGTTQYIPQGGEQGDPLMPMLCALGQHGSLVATQERMIGNKKVFAYLHDVFLAGLWGRCSPLSAKNSTPEPTSKCTMAKLRSDAQRNRGNHKSRDGGEARCRGLEGRSKSSSHSTRVQGVGRPSWPGSIHPRRGSHG